MAGKFWDKGIMLVTGCTKVSEGCKHCWSEQQHVIRSGNPRMHATYRPDCLTDGKFNGKVSFNLRLLERAAKVRKPQVYAIWNDLYHEGVTNKQIREAFYIMAHRPFDTFLIVTKRIHRVSEVFAFDMKGYNLPENIWHIVTCENQAMADERIPHLLKIPGKRGIIIEPMLASMDIREWLFDATGNFRIYKGKRQLELKANDNIHQVILGGETGHGARPMYPDWARSVRDQCAAAGVPFYFKAWGDKQPQGSRPITCSGREIDYKEHNELAWRK